MGLTLNVDKKGQWEQLSIAGPINEDAEMHLVPLVKSLGPNVIFNFKKVEYVNSCGVRTWINFLREVEKGRKIIFEECTPEIVSQINMIPNFRGSAHVKSVYASYACGDCDAQKNILFEEGRNLPQNSSDGGGEQKCDKCGNLMEMDELEDEFFAWVDAG